MMTFVLVLIISYYRGGVALAPVTGPDTGWSTLEQCQQAGRIVQQQNRDIGFVCVPRNGDQ